MEDNNFYQIESTLNNKKDNITDIYSYTFKKIKKIKRNVTIDEYGRMFLNGELFFPFGIYFNINKEPDLMLINQTHLNLVFASNKNIMDMIHIKTQGKIKVIYSLHSLTTLNLDLTTCSDLKEKENYKKILDILDEFKDHPALLFYKIHDEGNY